MSLNKGELQNKQIRTRLRDILIVSNALFVKQTLFYLQNPSKMKIQSSLIASTIQITENGEKDLRL